MLPLLDIEAMEAEVVATHAGGGRGDEALVRASCEALGRGLLVTRSIGGDIGSRKCRDRDVDSGVERGEGPHRQRS